MKTALISFALIVPALGFAGAAQAQSFDGPSIGAQAGWVKTDIRNPVNDLGITPIDANRDSATLGIYAAYDKTFGKVVIGSELGLDFGTSDTISGGTGGNRVSIDPKRSFNVSGRAGYLVTPLTLVYARGGYTNDRINTTLTTAASTRIASEDREGWLVGGGVERMITDHVSARVEYRYADLSDGDGKYDRHQVLTGIAFRF